MSWTASMEVQEKKRGKSEKPLYFIWQPFKKHSVGRDPESI